MYVILLNIYDLVWFHTITQDTAWKVIPIPMLW